MSRSTCVARRWSAALRRTPRDPSLGRDNRYRRSRDAARSRVVRAGQIGVTLGCTHARGCPLFPLLRASLRAWRDYYCDTEDRWRSCARYNLAVRGQPVPISLLPNGHHAEHIRRTADRSGTADTWQPPQRPPSGSDRGSPTRRAWFEPTTTQFEPAPAERHEPSPPTPTPGESAGQPVRPGQGSRRGWWTRLVDWMRGSA